MKLLRIMLALLAVLMILPIWELSCYEATWVVSRINIVPQYLSVNFIHLPHCRLTL